MLRLIAVAALAALGAGCSRDARLYPANMQAGPAPLQAKFVDSGTGSGSAELTMPDGEVLKGEFTTTDTSAYGFGSATAWSAFRPAPVVVTGSTTAVPGSMPGVATLVGPKGTTARCEYQVNSWTSSGAGVCQMSNGAVYNLHF